VLQSQCVKCHDGQYEGSFQLVPIKTRADRTADAFRANLDATLRLIDPENPSKSELLTSTLRAHGRGQHPRPIFPGSNDRAYQILATWANSLRSSKGPDETRRPEPGVAALQQEEPFAADRGRISREPLDRQSADPTAVNSGNPSAPDVPAANIIPPPLRYRGSVDLSAKQDNPDPRQLDFPLPPIVGGLKAPLPSTKDAAKKSGGRPAPSTTKASPSAPVGTGRTAAISRAGASTKTGGPADPAKTPDGSEARDDSDTPKKPSKPVKIDPKLLERMLNRSNGS
jgi:hypothetical protein